jgi:cyanate permease
MQMAGSLLLAFGDGMVPLAAGCVLFGLGVGNLTSLPPLIAQREFRPADVGTVVALVIAINQAIFAFAPAILGTLRDYTGNYVVAFLTAAAAQAVAAAIIVYGRRFT